MKILFPCEPFAHTKVDPSFAIEYECARTIGFETEFYDYEALVHRANPHEAICMVENRCDEEVSDIMLRGWMVNGETHSKLVKALRERNYNPITSEGHYERAHYLPAWHHAVSEHTALSAWAPGDNVDKAWAIYQPFRGFDAVIKDYVKSAKYRWKDGCFIPAGTDYERFCEIFTVFREERGNLFNRGVVIREFVPFEEEGGKIADLPVINERRIFFWKGEILAAGPKAPTDDPTWARLAKKINVPFMSMDVARRVDGRWQIMECGDGGVSGLPIDIEPISFYGALHNRINEDK